MEELELTTETTDTKMLVIKICAVTFGAVSAYIAGKTAHDQFTKTFTELVNKNPENE